MTAPLATLSSAAPAIAMIAAFACAIGGGYLMATKRDRKRGLLMLLMAVVLVGNVLIWTL